MKALLLLTLFVSTKAYQLIIRLRSTNKPNGICSTVRNPEQVAVSSLQENVLRTIESLRQESLDYADMFGLSVAEAGCYAVFAAIRNAPVPLGLKGNPFVLRHEEIVQAFGHDTTWPGFFTMKDLKKAVEDDFLDAARGTTDNRKAWQITSVSQPRGESFEEARMTFVDVQAALEKGTVIFNAAGAHIPKLAGPCLACADATLLPCALNLYVTTHGKRTSAPPHTDKQDVVVIQTSGSKRWKVFSVPDPGLKPTADVFARGKVDDSLPLYALESNAQLLVDTTLHPGDVLFCPAGYPHTTSTIDDDDDAENETSIHLTLGIDHHIWELDYLQARRLALRRASVTDTALGRHDENPFVGQVNQLSAAIRSDLFAHLPMGLLDEDEKAAALIESTTAELERISRSVDEETVAAVNPSIWKETTTRVRQQGRELLEIHRDMYLAAIEEGRTREAELAMTAHLGQTKPAMTPQQIQRLSLFRVKKFYDLIKQSKAALNEWSQFAITESNSGTLPVHWQFTLPLQVGDKVEADLGGAFFPATVSRASDGTFDVNFFDGDRETGLERARIKLISPPKALLPSVVDTSKMTPKQLKRWKKEQEKLKS